MSTLALLLGYGLGVLAVLCVGGLMARHVLIKAGHYNEDAMLEVHRLGGTGKVALGEELAKFGWEPQASGYVAQLSGRRARLAFASGTWTLQVDARGEDAGREEDAQSEEVRIEWGFHEDTASHGWPQAARVRCGSRYARAALAHEELRDAMAGLAELAPPRGRALGTLSLQPDGGYTLTSGPQRNDPVLDPRDWVGHATLAFESLTRALESERPPMVQALLEVIADGDAPTRARALALAAIREEHAGGALEALRADAPGAPLQLKIQWALTVPDALDPDEAYGLLEQAVTMSEGRERADALRALLGAFNARAISDRRLPPDVRADALVKASRAGEDVRAEIARVLRRERGSFRMLLIERLGAEDPDALREAAPRLIEEGDEPVVRLVVAALVGTQDPRDRHLLMRALDAPGGHHGELIEALEAFGDAACARALVAYASGQNNALGREAQAAAGRIAARVGALGSLSLSESAGRGGLELARRSGVGDISQV